eukprot:TRINITY_DN65054_c0_g1_i1.p1 TRINITY_DN65054_c0_g1~~TRINITY_DN65054_c0_g1_i1.p1  ORF type:complete len:421 (-),score=66.97 TRINITY_DN65054_c0_g1_i1:427-1689(-)
MPFHGTKRCIFCLVVFVLLEIALFILYITPTSRVDLPTDPSAALEVSAIGVPASLVSEDRFWDLLNATCTGTTCDFTWNCLVRSIPAWNLTLENITLSFQPCVDAVMSHPRGRHVDRLIALWRHESWLAQCLRRTAGQIFTSRKTLNQSVAMDFLSPFEIADRVVVHGYPEPCVASSRAEDILLSADWRSQHKGLDGLLRALPENAKRVTMYIRSDEALGVTLAPLLSDPRVKRVFIANVNCAYSHPKLYQFPLASRASANYFNGTRLQEHPVQTMQDRETLLLCAGMSTKGRGRDTRVAKIATLKRNGFQCLDFTENQVYMNMLLKSKFVFSPFGVGQQNFRDWEAIGAGAIPLLDDRDDCAKEVYEKLPVVFIKDWESVTRTFLEDKYEEVVQKARAGAYDLRRAHFPYWFHQLRGGI